MLVGVEKSRRSHGTRLFSVVSPVRPSLGFSPSVLTLCSDDVYRQRYNKKIKKEAEEKFGAAGEGEGSGGGAKTPLVKKTPAKKAAGEKGHTGKRKAKKNGRGGEEGEEDDEESPSKKVKMEQKEESEGELEG